MIAFAPLATAVALTGLSAVVGTAASARRARSVAIASMVGVLTANLVATVVVGLFDSESWGAAPIVMTLVPAERFVLVPVVFCLVGLVAVSLAPVVSHPPRTLARILLLIAAALCAIATDIAGVIVAAWILSAWVTWLELRSDPDNAKVAQLFAGCHLVSGACVLSGSVVLALGNDVVGVTLIVIGIAIRQAVIPLHSWFPTFVATAPLGVVVAFAAPQLGVYAHLSLLAGHAPEAFANQVAVVGAVTAIGAAALGVIQSEARRALAFVIISQTGLVGFGLESDSPVSMAGALVTWQVLALATSGFAMTLAALESRRGNLSLQAASGSFARTPRMGIALLVLGFASVGFPMTLGFVAEDLLVQGAVEGYPALCLVLIVATALNGMTVMRFFFFLFSGTTRTDGGPDLVRREINALTAVIFSLLLAGALPRLVVPVLPSPGNATAPRSDSHSPESAAKGVGSSANLRSLQHISQR